MRRETEKKKPPTNGRGAAHTAATSTVGGVVTRGSKTKAFLKKVASQVSRASSLVKAKATAAPEPKKPTKKPANTAAKKAAAKKVAAASGMKKPARSVKTKAKKPPARKVAKRAVRAGGSKGPARETKARHSKAGGRQEPRKSTAALGKKKAPKRAGRRVLSTPPRKQGASSVSSIRLVLEALDPRQAVVYWEVHPRALTRAREVLRETRPRSVLRVYEVSGLAFDGTNANESFDVVVDINRGTHYLRLPSPGSTLISELGLQSRDGRFEPMVRSNVVDLPRGSQAPEVSLIESSPEHVGGVPSPLWRRRWAVSIAPVDTTQVAEAGEEALPAADEEARSAGVTTLPAWSGRAVPVAGAARSTPPTRRAAPSIGTTADFVRGISSVGFAGLSSMGFAGESPSSPGAGSGGDRAHFEIQADLVIYGRARPDSDLVIEGVPLRVRKDGTFELRFTLGSVPWRDDQPPP